MPLRQRIKAPPLALREADLDGFEMLAKPKGLEHLHLVDNDRLKGLAPLRWLVQLKSLDPIYGLHRNH
jgi:hypothetical protein